MTDYKVGQHVEVSISRTWTLATVEEVGELKIQGFKIHYDKWDSAYDEVKPLSDCKYRDNSDITDPSKIAPGTQLIVVWLGTWYNSTVLEVIQSRVVKVSLGASNESIWIEENKIRPAKDGAADGSSVNGGPLAPGQKIKTKRYNKELDGVVLESRSQLIYKVTYDGWGSVYDEGILPDACKYRDGSKIANPEDVKAGSKLNIKWADGGWYAATVLSTELAIAKVHWYALPAQLDAWVTEDEIVGGLPAGPPKATNAPSTTANQGQKLTTTGSVSADQSEMPKDAGFVGYQGERPKPSKTAIETFEEDDPEDKWQDMLTSELLPQGVLLDMEEKAKSMKKPVWSGQQLKSGEYEASIVATSDDMDFAEKLSHVLEKRGIKVTTDVDKIHDSRVFLLIYSESTSRDENVVRHLTRAAERFNMNETIIVPVVRPGCSARSLDKIPDNIAYSLANTSFINLSSFGDPLQKALGAAVNELTDLIRRYARSEKDWCVSGTWCCQAIVEDQRSGQRKVKDFIVLLHQDGTKITGRCAAEWEISGDVSGDVVHLKFKFRGEWSQNDEGNWTEDDYMMVGEIAAVIVNQGYRLEGNYADRTDAGKSAVPGRGVQRSKSVGLFNATLERSGLSGVYRASYTDSDLIHYIGLVHRGGNAVILENSWACGVRHVAFYDTVSRYINISSNHQFYSWTIFGKASDDSTKGVVIEGLFVFVDTSGVTEQNLHIKMERDELHTAYMNSTKSYGDENELMALYNLQADRQIPIPFKPYIYKPLALDEYAALICCTKHEKSKAEKLKTSLQDMAINPITLDLSKADKARTLVVLLSSHTQESTELIEVLSRAADQEKPIFNIGLDSWFAIFGESSWKDQNLRLKLMNALARLNQTPETTLERHHSNFHGLVKGIRKYTDPPVYYLTGLWELEYIDVGMTKKTKFTDIYEPQRVQDDGGEEYDGYFSEGEIENVSGQPLRPDRPLMIFIYFNPATNEVIQANDFSNLGLTGKIDTETYQLKMWSASAKYTFHINSTNDAMLGMYINKVTKRKYKVVATYSSEGISGVYRFLGSLIGVSQSAGGVATIITGYGVSSAVVSNGRLVFHPAMPKGKEQLTTFAARINEYEDGVRLEGYIYASTALTPRQRLEAVQLATSLNRIIKTGDKVLTAPPEVVKLVQSYFDVLEKKDYDQVLPLLSATAKQNYPKAVFMKETEDHMQNEGKFIRNSAKLVGRREMSTGGQKIGQTRYEFDLDFERRKKWRMMFLVGDNDGLIAGLESLEEEARSQHLSEYDVMISYRSWDARWVDLLQQYLEKHNIIVWRDRRMEVGVNWSEDITRAARKSGCVVSAISENYLASSLCTKEVRMARDIGRTVIPVILPETHQTSDPRNKLVSSHYKGQFLPHTVARELSAVSWVDFRDESNLKSADPKDLKSFQKKYQHQLDTLVDMICEINGYSRVFNLTGEWLLTVGDGDDIEEVALNITSMDGNKLNGSLILAKFRAIEFPLDEYSYFEGSNLRVSGSVKIGILIHTFIVSATLSSDGESLTGSYQMLEKPVEVGIGEKLDQMFLISHRRVTNGCYKQPVKGTRKGQGANLKGSFQEKQVRWAPDMKKAMQITGKSSSDVQTLLKSFNLYDRDGSAELDLDELDLAIRHSGGRATKQELMEMMQEVDTDNSGTVDFYEYLGLLMKATPKSKGGSMLAKSVKSRFCTIQ